jgi:hypothetical protein
MPNYEKAKEKGRHFLGDLSIAHRFHVDAMAAAESDAALLYHLKN